MKPIIKVSSSPEIWSGHTYVIRKTTDSILEGVWYYLTARGGKFSGAYATFEEAVAAEEYKEVAHANAGT